jgi:hypothetical protein
MHLHGHFGPETGRSKSLRNAGINLQCHMVSKTTTIPTPVTKVQILEDRIPRTDDNPHLTRNVFIVYNQESTYELRTSGLYAAADDKK